MSFKIGTLKFFHDEHKTELKKKKLPIAFNPDF